MEKYRFDEYKSPEYEIDPVFKTKNFRMYGDPLGFEYDPILFEVYNIGNQARIRYCLVRPIEFIRDENKLLKIRRYLIYSELKKKTKDLVNTYFVGDVQKSLSVSSEFSNQNIVLTPYEIIESWYPKKLSEKLNKIIYAVVQTQTFLGEQHNFLSLNDDITFVDDSLSKDEKTRYKRYLMDCMKQEGLISIINGGFALDVFTLTSKAFDLIENENSVSNKTCFIALKFDGNEERINVIQKAVAKAGFDPVVMNQVETNNWIMPEIFDRIENSRFVIVDFSLPCDGAYYEAGYAAALKKPVIHLFDSREESDSNKLHFDIAQKSTIFYKDFNDLKERLINRIRATIK